MICERCNNNQVQTINYSSCAQANADNAGGHNDWIPEQYIPSMSWQTAGDGTICTPYGQNLKNSWLNSSMNTVNLVVNTGGGDDQSGGDPSGGDPVGDPVSDPVGGYDFGNPTALPCGDIQMFIDNSNGQTFNASVVNNDGVFRGYLCMRCEGVDNAHSINPKAYGSNASALGVPNGTWLTCDQANTISMSGHNDWAPQHTFFLEEPCGCSQGSGVSNDPIVTTDPRDPIITLDDRGNQVVIPSNEINECYVNTPPVQITTAKEETTATVTCELETIPVPRVNNITDLICITKSDIFNKPTTVGGDAGDESSEEDDNDETIQYPVDELGNTLIETGLINYLSAAGGTHQFRVLGDHMANFDLVVYNETTNKYYDWVDNNDGTGQEFINGYNVLNGKANAVALGHPDTFDVVFPTVSVATTYKVYFVESAPTIYKPFTTPTDLTAKWTINQLVNITTTVNWGSTASSLSTVTDGSNGSTVAYTFSTSAGANLSSNPNVSGEKAFTITFFISGAKTIDWTLARKDFYGTGVHNDVVTIDDIDTPDTGDLSSILSINATASFVNNGEGAGCTGTITGSMTFGQMPLVNQSIIFNPDSFFTIT